MTNETPSRRLADEYLLPAILAAVTLLVHLIGNAHYGFFRDELYFIICGRHPDFGYVDQPPLTPLLAAASQAFGISLFMLRLVPALFAAGGVFVTTRLVREFGGGAFAQTLAGICVALAPVFLSFGMKVGTDMVGLMLWPLAALYIARLIQGADPRWWIGVGLALGIAGEAKYSVLFYAVALLVGLALSPSRRIMFTPWFPVGIGVALLVVAPNVAWQATHGFPMIELLQNGAHGKNIVLSPVAYILADIVIQNPLLSLVWLAGLVWAFVRPATRWLGWSFLAMMVMMIVLHAKDYYPADAYPPLFALGAVGIELWTRRLTFLRPVTAVVALAAGIAMVPLAMPVLSETQLVSYQTAFTGKLPIGPSEHHKAARLLSDFADMHGWPELTASVAHVYDGLSPSERASAGINASNYGEASAINFFGPALGLPFASSGHNQYWIWGPHFRKGGVLVDVNGDEPTLKRVCTSVALAATFTNEWIMPYEDDLPIYVCRGLKVDVAKVWPLVRNYN